MTEPWSIRIQRIMNALGWPAPLMAERLGLSSHGSVLRLLRGGRPRIDALLKLQAIERLYAGEIEKQKLRPGRRVRKAHLWPPPWIRCNQRWWVERQENKPPSRPEDLASLGASSADPAAILVGRLDPRNFPGRTLRVVDWTAAGRDKYARDCEERARRYAASGERKTVHVGSNPKGEA